MSWIKRAAQMRNIVHKAVIAQAAAVDFLSIRRTPLANVSHTWDLGCKTTLQLYKAKVL